MSGSPASHPETLEVTADGIRLRQALDNLIGNAILYGRPDGHVHVTVEESGDRGRGHRRRRR